MAAKGRTEMEVGADAVAVITICNPPVNSLSIDGTSIPAFDRNLFCFSFVLIFFLLGSRCKCEV